MASDDEMDKIRAQLDQMSMSGTIQPSTVDDLASTIQRTLNFGFDSNQCASLAELMVQMSLENAKKKNSSSSHSPNENLSTFPRPAGPSAFGSFRSPKPGPELSTIQQPSNIQQQTKFSHLKPETSQNGMPPSHVPSPHRFKRASTPPPMFQPFPRGEEKKEDPTSQLKPSFSQYRSGRESPSFDSPDAKPPVPGSPYRRAASPAPDAAEDQPMVPGSPARQTRPASRCSSPRPGLQDEDDNDAVPASPVRPESPAPYQFGMQPGRSRSPFRFTQPPGPTRARSQSPKPDTGKEKTTTQSFPIPMDNGIFTPPPHKYSQPVQTDETLFTPELQKPQVEHKTGLFKQRRKDGTPPLASSSSTSAADSAKQSFVNDATSAFAEASTAPTTTAPWLQGKNCQIPSESACPPDVAGSVPAFHFGSDQVKFSIGNNINKKDRRRPKISAVASHTSTNVDVDTPTPKKSSSPFFSPMDIDHSIMFSPGATFGGFTVGTAHKTPHTRRKNKSAFGSPVSQTKAADTETESRRVEETPSRNQQNGALAYVTELRELAKNYYANEDYKGSIQSYTNAIYVVKENQGIFPGDVLALLYSNRAAALVMIGAYATASKDCIRATSCASTACLGTDPFSKEAGQPLQVKILARLGRAEMKLGNIERSKEAFDRTIELADNAIRFSQQFHTPDQHNQMMVLLSQMMTEATIGLKDVKTVTGLDDEIARLIAQGTRNQIDRESCTRALAKTNIVLSFCPGSERFMAKKLLLLAKLGRWREMSGFLERLAALYVRFDHIFTGDLVSESPFPGVEPAIHLPADHFGGVREEDAGTALLKLGPKASREAILRLPMEFMQYYLRALRLEERYPAAEAALEALELYKKSGLGRRYSKEMLELKLDWLATERDKLFRTKILRARGDDLYKTQDYDLALVQYGKCLTIDAEGLQPVADKANAGGRLHAVLHCNRAACLIALNRHHDAIEECSAAVRIHSRYMKALSRRARSYTRLNRHQEAINEYQHYISLVEGSRKGTNNGHSIPIAPVMFDGPDAVTDADLDTARKELAKAQEAKLKAEAAAKAHSQRRQESYASYTNFDSTYGAGANARQRQEKWRNQKQGTPHWDSFSNRGPKSSSNRRKEYSRASSWGQQRFDENDQKKTSGGPRNGPRRQSSFDSPRSAGKVNYYDVLEIPMIATTAEIKKAYYKQAKRYHPDKNEDPEESARFLLIKEAYDTLTNDVKRRNHDNDLNNHRGFHYGYNR